MDETADQLKDRIVSFVSRLKLANVFPGEWESVFKGEGIEFSESRAFEPGDNPRDIDLFTLAQSGNEETILRDETRQMQVYAWADFSSSMQRLNEMIFAHKADIRNTAIGLILFSAVKLYCPIGFYPFGLQSPKFFKPKTGDNHCLEIMEWALKENGQNVSSFGVEMALASVLDRATPKNMVFFLSDFKQKIFDEDFTSRLAPMAAKFDFIPIVILDPLETRIKPSRSFGKQNPPNPLYPPCATSRCESPMRKSAAMP